MRQLAKRKQLGVRAGGDKSKQKPQRAVAKQSRSEKPMTMQEFHQRVQCLEQAGCLNEIHNKDGTIRPSLSAIKRVRAEYPNEEPAQKWRLAQAQTLIDTVNKYQIIDVRQK